MARRRSSEDTDPFDDFGSDLEDMDIDDLRIDDDSGGAEEDIADLDFDDETGDVSAQLRGAGMSPVQVIVGLIQVIFVALVALAIFLVLAFGAVYGAQRAGLVATRVPGGYGAPSISLLPTVVPTAVPQQATLAPTVAPAQQSVPAAAPSDTPDTGCANAAAWWNSQPIQSNYVYFTQQALNDVTAGAQPIAALINQMGVHRSYVANVPADPCLSDALNALLHGFDATTDEARAINGGDPATIAQTQSAALQAYAALTAALWAVGVNPDSSATMPDKSTKGSGVACGAQTWYSAVKPHVDSFNSAAQQIDVVNSTAQTARTQITTMQAERGNVAEVSVPGCAQQAQQLVLGALDSDVAYYQQRLAGNSGESQQSDYTHQNQLFMAWLLWLGISE